MQARHASREEELRTEQTSTRQAARRDCDAEGRSGARAYVTQKPSQRSANADGCARELR